MGDRLKHLKARSDQERQEMLVLFSTSNDSILTFQERQWKATNYGLLLLGGVFACSRLLLEPVVHVLLYVLACLAMALTWYVLGKLEEAITKARDTVDAAILALSPRFRDANYPNGFLSKNKRTTLLILFRFVLLSGFIIFSVLFFCTNRI